MMLYFNSNCIAIRAIPAAETEAIAFCIPINDQLRIYMRGVAFFDIFLAASNGIEEICLRQMLESGGVTDTDDKVRDLLQHEVLVKDRPPQLKWDSVGWFEPWIFHRIARASRYLEYDSSNGRLNPDAIRDNAITRFFQHGEPTTPIHAQNLESIVLPRPTSRFIRLSGLLHKRRTVREFEANQVTQEALSFVLSTGTARLLKNLESQDDESCFMSHSDLVPFRVYCVIRLVENIPPGIYRYSPRSNQIDLVELGDFDEQVVHAIWGQPMGYDNAFSLFLTARYEEYQRRYRSSRAYMNLLVGVGELAQYLILAAHSIELGACMTPALRDRELSEYLKIDGRNEEALYYVGIGLPKDGNGSYRE